MSVVDIVVWVLVVGCVVGGCYLEKRAIRRESKREPQGRPSHADRVDAAMMLNDASRYLYRRHGGGALDAMLVIGAALNAMAHDAGPETPTEETRS